MVNIRIKMVPRVAFSCTVLRKVGATSTVLIKGVLVLSLARFPKDGKSPLFPRTCTADWQNFGGRPELQLRCQSTLHSFDCTAA